MERNRNAYRGNVKEIRKLQGRRKQEDFADFCGIARSTLTRIYAGGRADLSTFVSIATKCETDDVYRLVLTDVEADSSRLCGRIAEFNLWPSLLEAIQHVAVIMGSAAMKTYTTATREVVGGGDAARILDGIRASAPPEKNETIEADLAATIVGVRVADLLLRPIIDRLGCGVMYLSEELVKHAAALDEVLGDVSKKVPKPAEFYRHVTNVIRLLLDELDGSKNHRRRLAGLFACTGALIIDDQPRVSAIYDPTSDIVYSAVLFGPYEKPDAQSSAFAWEKRTGHVTDLVQHSQNTQPGKLNREAIAIHLPRSNKEARRLMINRLEALAEAAESIYSLNCGVAAMLKVATGDLVCYINPQTSKHDLSSAEVICRACNLKFSDWNGKEIDYNDQNLTSVIVARPEYYDEIRGLLCAPSSDAPKEKKSAARLST